MGPDQRAQHSLLQPPTGPWGNSNLDIGISLHRPSALTPLPPRAPSLSLSLSASSPNLSLLSALSPQLLLVPGSDVPPTY